MTLKVIGASPIIYQVLPNLSNIASLDDFKVECSKKKLNLAMLKNIYVSYLNKFNLQSKAKQALITLSLIKHESLDVFTKKRNFNKLYVNSSKNIFLSPGIVLRFLKQNDSKYLKKRLKTWHGYIKAIKILQKNSFILRFRDLYGKKGILMQKLLKSKLNISIIFIRFFYLQFSLHVKKKRRIKRWIKKKYYQIEINEKK